jgi:hypothetical protein
MSAHERCLRQFSEAVQAAFNEASGVGHFLTTYDGVNDEIYEVADFESMKAAEAVCAACASILEHLSVIIRWTPVDFWDRPSPIPEIIIRSSIRFESEELTKCLAEFSKVSSEIPQIGNIAGTSYHDAALQWSCRCVERIYPCGSGYDLAGIVEGIARKEEKLLASSFSKLPSFLFARIRDHHLFCEVAWGGLAGLSKSVYPFLDKADVIAAQLKKEFYALDLHESHADIKGAVPLATTPDAATLMDRTRKPKRSTQNGDARAKLIAALTKHHQYADGGCLNQEPIGNNALAELAKVGKASASGFLKEKFGGLEQYQKTCLNMSSLVATLKLLNNEFAPRHLLSGEPTYKPDLDDED